MNYRIDRVDGRARLRARRAPHWHRLTQGRSLGFRKLTAGSPGTWLARVRDGSEYKQKPLGDFATLPEKERFDAAKRAAEEWFSHLDLGGSAKPGDVKATCAAYVEHQRSEKSEAAATAAAGYYRRLVDKDPIGRVDLAKATKQQFEAWRIRVRKASGSDASFNRNLTPIRAALNHARNTGRVATDQAWRQALKPIKGAGNRRTLYLDRDARRALVENCSDAARPLVLALALLPLRVGELAKCRVADLDLKHRALRVPVGKTKARDVPLGGEAFTHLKACAKNKLPSAWLVARPDGSQWKKEAWRDEVKLAAAGAKLPHATVAYTLRHSTITDLVVGGADPLTVARLAGTSIAMIDKNYGHLRREHARTALDGLGLK